MKSIYNITLENLEQILIENGYKKFNAHQIYDWLYKKRIKSLDEMTNIKKDLIEFLKNNYKLETIKLIKKSHKQSPSTRGAHFLSISDYFITMFTILPGT